MPAKKIKNKTSFIQSGKLDITFLSLVLILLSIGLVMLFSASYAYSYTYYGNSYRFISRQALFAIIGVAIMLGVSKIDYGILKKLSWVIYAVTIAMLVVVLIIPPMSAELNVHRWLYIGSFSFQPSEIAKFSIIVLFSAWLAANSEKIKKLRYVAWLLLLLAIVCVLVVREPHLSATILIFALGIVLMVVGGL